jgi:hypothetical protein
LWVLPWPQLLAVRLHLLKTPASDEESSESEIEEVIVLGIRASLESALAAKRERANLTEIINADDIGKLPDENVAKS